MSTEITQINYRYIILDDEPTAAAAALDKLCEVGIGLVGFSEFPHGPGKSQIDLIVEESERLKTAAATMGLTLSHKKPAFLIRGEEDPGVVVVDLLNKLANAHIRVTSMQAISAGAGRFGALLWVAPPDVEAASRVLGAVVSIEDVVNEASEESFPASDPPAWTMSPSA